ncbi:MAG: Mth938-like domain-containing protein [Pseudomonadota bacterium]|nr:MAG: Mth938-like domain-containing protein [Pseudomonadota bacterium]
MQVTRYEFGRIEVDGKTFTSDVIILPEQVNAEWWRKQGHRLDRDDLEEVVASRPEVLVIGTGCYGRMMVPDETRTFLEAQGIELHIAPTATAVEEFNRLQRQCANVVAALHLTC